MKHVIQLALLCSLFLCACHAPSASSFVSLTTTPTTSTQASTTATSTVSDQIPTTPIAVYIPQPAETAVTPKWNGPQVSCDGKPFAMWGSPGTYLYQSDGGALFTVVLKPGDAAPSFGVYGPDTLSKAGVEDVTTGLGTFRATHLAAVRDYNMLTGRLDSIKGSYQRHEWYVCGYGLVKLTSSESETKSPGNYSSSSREDFVLISFTPMTTSEAHIRYSLRCII